MQLQAPTERPLEAEVLLSRADVVAVHELSATSLAVLTYNRRSRWTKVAKVDLGTGVTSDWLSVFGIVPTGFAVSKDTSRVALTYGTILFSALHGFGGMLVLRRSRLVSFKAFLAVAWHFTRIVCALGALCAATLIKINRLSSYWAEVRRQAVERRKQRHFAECWSWPTSVSFVHDTVTGIELLIVATSTALYRGIPHGRPKEFDCVVDGLMNCTHVSRIAALHERECPQFIVTEGHLHVPDLWLTGPNSDGLGAIWRWSSGDKLDDLLLGFARLGGASSVVVNFPNTWMCYLRQDACAHTSCWVVLLGDVNGAHAVRNVVSPRYVAPLGKYGFAICDDQGVKRVSLPVQPAQSFTPVTVDLGPCRVLATGHRFAADSESTLAGLEVTCAKAHFTSATSSPLATT